VPQIIELPDGTEAEFPDDMQPDQIESVLRKQFAPQPKIDALSLSSARPRPLFEMTPTQQLITQPPRFPVEPTAQSAPDVAPRPFPIFDPRAIEQSNLESEEMRHASPVPTFPSSLRLQEMTGLPEAVTLPVSAVGRLGTSIGQFVISPAGASEMAVAATPAAPVMFAKWGYDMLKAGKESAENIGRTLGGMLDSWVGQQIARANNLGEPAPIPAELKQQLAEDVVNTIAMTAGGGKAVKDAIRGGMNLPKTMRQRGQAFETEGAMLDFERATRNQPMLDADALASTGLGLPPRATPEMLPELQRTRDLADRAIQEATQRIIVPGQPSALQQLREMQVADRVGANEAARTTPVPEFRPGGGEAVGGKESFNRPAGFFDRESEAQGLGRQSGAPTLEDIRAQRAAEAREAAAPAKPEVAKIPEPNEFNKSKNPFGDPSGTTYHATPADWAAWTDLQSKPITFDSFGQREAIKNKYGGMPPEPPRQGTPPPQPEAPLVGQQPAKVVATEPTVEQKLASLKFSGNGGLSKNLYSLRPDVIQKIGKQVWNDSIDLAIAAVKAGKSVKEAVEAAIKHIRYNAKGFNEAELRQQLESELGNASAVPSTRPAQSAGASASAVAKASTSGASIAPTPVSQAGQPRVEGGETRTRRSAERATTAESVPEPVQERIAESPESKYSSQPFEDVKTEVGRMSDADLAATNPKSNIYVASKLELANRLFAAGNLEGGYRTFMDVAKQGTDLGQNINQFKLLQSSSPLNIVKLVNEGLKESKRDPLSKTQMEELAKIADEAMKSDRALEAAKQEWQRNPTDANAKLADDALKASDAAGLTLQRKMNGYRIKSWPKMLQTFIQGNLLSPISHVANTVGNLVGATMEQSSRSYGSLIDMVRAGLSGTQRQLTVRPIRGTVEAAKGIGRGLAQAPSILAKGSGDVVKGETRAQLQPLRALAKAFAKNPDVPTTGGKVSFNDRAKLAVEGTFGIAPETMLRLLSAADKPAYNAARARLIAEQMKLQKKGDANMKMAQKFPELFFDRDTIKRINDEAANAIFQRPSKVVRYLQSLIHEKGGDWGDLAFTIAVAPYKLTPWNLVVRTLQYNPILAAMESGYHAKQGNVRKAEIAAGRMIVGSIIYGAGYFLYQNGLIGPSLSGADEAQKARMLSGEVIPPNHVNLSGLKRLAEGGNPTYQPGDETFDLTRGGGAAGAILTSMANIGRDNETKPDQSSQEAVQSLLQNSILEQANFTINQSFLKGVTGALDALQNKQFDRYVEGLENSILSIPTPNTLSALSRSTRQNVPETKDSTWDKVVANRFGILGADDYLPTKRDLWGEPMLQTPEGRNALVYHLFDIGKGRQVTSDPIALELYRLWRTTANNSVIPSIPERTLTHEKQSYPLNDEQYSRMAELVGKQRREIVDGVFKEPEWNKATDEQKIAILERVYERGAKVGRDLFATERLKDLEAKPARAGFKMPQ